MISQQTDKFLFEKMVIPVVFFEFQEMAIMQDLAPFASDLPRRGGQGRFPSMRAYHLKPATSLKSIHFHYVSPHQKMFYSKYGLNVYPSARGLTLPLTI